MSRSSEIREMRGLRPRLAPTYSGSSAPSNYVAGLGRGAVGFTTRSDIGPAGALMGSTSGSGSGMMPPPAPVGPIVRDFGPAPAGYVAGRGRGMGDLARAQEGGTSAPVDRMDYSESNYDEFSGYSERLFGDTPYEEDDAEADRVYAELDERMEAKRKRKREQARLEILRSKKAGSKISDQFADLKGKLVEMSAADWEAIPDAGDKTTRRRQMKAKDVFTPLPDHVIEAGRSDFEKSVDPSQGGSSTSAGLAEARGKVLGLNLDRMSDSVSGQTVVDPKGYLTDLNSIKLNSSAEIGDIEKARLLLRSVTSSNPNHGPGWIAAARVEEFAGKLVVARKIIKQGCEVCPDNEDVWLEAARLQTPDNAKVVLANAVRHLPTSVKIWLRAAQLEQTPSKKKIVLRRALEFIPNSVKLWRTAIEMEGEEDARIMLSRAVECIPQSVEMWLALARLETYENARRVLNSARSAIPTEPAIWIHAAKLEEAHGNGEAADRIIPKALESLKSFQVVLDREKWLKEAEAAEQANSPHTCAAIVRAVVRLGVDPEDRQNVWLDDAESSIKRHSFETARTIFSEALKELPSSKVVWIRAAMFERQHGTSESCVKLLSQAVEQCPQEELLWLMWAKDTWLIGDVPGARSILQRAFAANSNSEQIWLAAAKLELENNEKERARLLLAKARDRASSGRIWMKSSLLERELGNIPHAIELLDDAIRKYPHFSKLYMMAAEYAIITPLSSAGESSGQDRARAYYASGLQRCPLDVTLWRLAARFEEKYLGVVKARATLELARLRNPKSAELWLESVRLELRTGNPRAASNVMSRALQECPNSGILWAEEILTVPAQQQKSRSIEALKRCDNDPHVITAVARLFERDRKYPKARKWFIRAVTIDPDNGDAWAAYYKFELAHGRVEQQQEVMHKCITAEPAHGELWCSISKKTEWARLSKGEILLKAAAALRAQEKDNQGEEDE